MCSCLSMNTLWNLVDTKLLMFIIKRWLITTKNSLDELVCLTGFELLLRFISIGRIHICSFLILPIF